MVRNEKCEEEEEEKNGYQDNVGNSLVDHREEQVKETAKEVYLSFNHRATSNLRGDIIQHVHDIGCAADRERVE
jgi:hypothetical protein